MGPNSLRGGKKIFSHKTLVANWTEETYKPEVANGSFTKSRFVTTTMDQQSGGYSGKQTVAMRYGSGVVRARKSSAPSRVRAVRVCGYDHVALVPHESYMWLIWLE